MPTDISKIKPQLQVQDENVPLTRRDAIDFVGAGVTATDGGDRTIVTIPGGGAGATGIWGIADATGTYTFYANLGLAIAAAVSGDTIVLFTNYTETVSSSVFYKNGVNINLNGHTYEYAVADINDTLSDGGIPATVTIFNGTLKRTNSSAPTNTTGVCLKVSNNSSNVTLQGVTVIAEDGSNCCIVQGGKLSGGYYRQIGAVAGSTFAFQIANINAIVGNVNVHADDKYSITTGLVTDSYFRSDGNIGLNVGTGGRARNCTAYSTANVGLYVVGEAFNCVGDSTSNSGIFGSNAGVLHNCTGKSTGGIGIYHGYQCYNSVGYSTSTYGMQILGNSQTIRTVNSTAFSSAAAAINNRAQIYNCSAITEWNDATGHAIISNWPNSNVHDCYVEVANSAAYGVHAPGNSIYTTNVTGKGMNVLLNILSNLQVNTEDSFGNILIG